MSGSFSWTQLVDVTSAQTRLWIRVEHCTGVHSSGCSAVPRMACHWLTQRDATELVPQRRRNKSWYNVANARREPRKLACLLPGTLSLGSTVMNDRFEHLPQGPTIRDKRGLWMTLPSFRNSSPEYVESQGSHLAARKKRFVDKKTMLSWLSQQYQCPAQLPEIMSPPLGCSWLARQPLLQHPSAYRSNRSTPCAFQKNIPLFCNRWMHEITKISTFRDRSQSTY